MLKERRDWVAVTKEMNGNKIPDDIKAFHERFKVEEATPDDDEKKEVGDDGKKGKDKAKKEKGKKKGKKGKGGGGDDGDIPIIKIGTSEIVQKFDEHYDAYNETWVSRDETDNYKQ
jgi:hypothetical protein